MEKSKKVLNMFFASNKVAVTGLRGKRYNRKQREAYNGSSHMQREIVCCRLLIKIRIALNMFILLFSPLFKHSMQFLYIV